MIIVKLMGGMGNQMFQYAFGRSLSIKYNLPIKIDLSFLKRRDMGPNFVYRDYDLDLFNIEEDFNISPTKKIYTLPEPHFHYSQNCVDALSGIDGHFLIDGYWQTPLYFNESQTRKDFTFKNPIENSDNVVAKEMLNNIQHTESVMINVRRTDYLNTSFHGVMDMSYINSAVEIIKSKVSNPRYFIFSDDIDWCKDNIKLDNMTFVDHNYKGDRFGWYLQLMSTCKHFIIPNSTFAWWAAWLNNNPDKVVIAPTNWFTDVNINTNDIIPSNWIRI